MADVSTYPAPSGSPPEPEILPGEMRTQVERITRSQTFAHSHQLRKFLEFVAHAALDGCPEEIKEYTIATRVFGRGVDFDPRQDTLVRTQASRLRLRLDAYYKTEGASDEVVLDLPKGHYVPRFERRKSALDVAAETALPALPPAPPAVVEASSGSDFLIDLHFRLPRRAAMLGMAAVLLLAAGLGWSGWRARAAPRSGTYSAIPALTAEFWSGFIDRQSPPLASFGDHAYLMTESAEILRYSGDETFSKGALIPPSIALRDPRLAKYLGPLYFNDDFTGTGEVYAVARLDRLFAKMGTPLDITRSQLLSPADLNQRNAILIGHSAANAIAGQIGDGAALPFVWGHGGARPWGGRIVNRNPEPGESPFYEVERDPNTRAVRADYALATFLPGLAPGKRLAVLEGVTTEGTRGAAEFLASDAGLAQLASSCGVPGKYGRRIPPPFFQAVLRVEIAKGDILRVQYVTSRVLHR